MAKKKKALIAVNYIGFMWFLFEDIELLGNLGYDVIVAGDDHENQVLSLKGITDRGGRFVDIRIDSKSPLTKKNLQGYKALIKEEKFDLIICHTPITGLIVRLASASLRCSETKVIYYTHGLAWTHLSSIKDRIKFKTMEYIGSLFCDAIVTINKEDFNSARKLYCKNVFQINGVGLKIQEYRDVDINIKEYRHRIGVDDKKILILAVGELSDRKNHVIIVDAISRLPNKEQYCYVICGRELTAGGTANVIKERAKDKGVDVRLLGRRNDIKYLVHCADIGVIPSKREGLGMSGLEQLCAGVPLIGTRVQGIQDYIIDDKTGYCIDNPNDAHGFASAIMKLSDKKIRDSMKDNCLKIVENFSLSISLSQRESIYREIIGIKEMNLH